MAFDYNDTAVSTRLVRAVLANDSSATEEALKLGFNANLNDNRGWTPLHLAALADSRINCLKTIVQHSSVSINSQTFLGETALFMGCQNGCQEVVKLLLNQPKCLINLSNNEGVSPLHVACSEKHSKVMQLLVKHGAAINSQDLNGYTPLHETVSTIHSKRNCSEDTTLVLSYLLCHGADPNVKDHEGNKPLHLACQNGLLKCVDELLNWSTALDSVNCCNNDGRTPLMIAVMSQNAPVIELLLSKQANPDLVDVNNLTALHLAAHSANFEIFSIILQATSDACINTYCTFNEVEDYDSLLFRKRINSLACLAIDTEDFNFLNKVLECGIVDEALQCPVIHEENAVEKTFVLHTPISFLLESKMFDLDEKTVDFLITLVGHGIPLKKVSFNPSVSYVDPVCAAFVALNDCSVNLVMKCLRSLFQYGADPDYPYGRMPFSMEQACVRNCTEAVLLLIQESNILEPDYVLKWIEDKKSCQHEELIRALLPLAPYHKSSLISPSNFLNIFSVLRMKQKKVPIALQVCSLASFCRSVIRKQLHEESKSEPGLFKSNLFELDIPKALKNYLRFIEN